MVLWDNKLLGNVHGLIKKGKWWDPEYFFFGDDEELDLGPMVDPLRIPSF